MISRRVRVVIAGGGTGGHLYPGIAVARELLARDGAAEVSFAGTAGGIESRVLPREGFTGCEYWTPLREVERSWLKRRTRRFRRLASSRIRS